MTSHDSIRSARYNRGTVQKEKRAGGVVWVFRWSERINGRRHHYKELLGTLKKLPPLRFKLNEDRQQLKPVSFGDLIHH